MNALSQLTGAAFDAIKGVFLIGDPPHTANLPCNVDNNGGNTTYNVNGISEYEGVSIPANWFSKTLDVCIYVSTINGGVCQRDDYGQILLSTVFEIELIIFVGRWCLRYNTWIRHQPSAYTVPWRCAYTELGYIIRYRCIARSFVVFRYTKTCRPASQYQTPRFEPMGDDTSILCGDGLLCVFGNGS